jgi:hypothetical protein
MSVAFSALMLVGAQLRDTVSRYLTRRKLLRGSIRRLAVSMSLMLSEAKNILLAMLFWCLWAHASPRCGVEALHDHVMTAAEKYMEPFLLFRGEVATIQQDPPLRRDVAQAPTAFPSSVCFRTLARTRSRRRRALTIR